MKKNISIWGLVCFMFACVNLQAQLANGSIVPDFTVTDIDGMEHHLYDYLDEDYVVILDFSATWCGPCWTYMESGILEEIHDNYGPDGTDEIIVIFIEGDATTSSADLNGTGGNTIGDWVSNINYPIIDGSDGANLANLFQISFFPTMYTVYPNRTIVQSGQQTLEGHLALTTEDNYLIPTGVNNAGILGLTSSPFICGSTEPIFRVQNLGSSNLTSLTLDLAVDGALIQTLQWTGSLPQYDYVDVVFDEIAVTGAVSGSLTLSNPNGMLDEGADGNFVSGQFVAPIYSPNNSMSLTLVSDNYPQEVTVEIIDPNGSVFASWSGTNDFTAGVPTVIDFADLGFENSGCYQVRLFDSYGDGISLGGSLALENDGAVLYQDADFNVASTDAGSEVFIPFNVNLSQAITGEFKVFLEGPYLGNGLMNAQGNAVLPLNSPYTEAPYNGPFATVNSLPENTVDWVLVEIRSGTPSPNPPRTTTTLQEIPALLLADGSIVGTDGNPLPLEIDGNESYHIAIRHRNHLDVLSANSVSVVNGVLTYDFTTDIGQAYGAQQMKTASDGKAMLYTGDFNSDLIIQTTDFDVWFVNPALLNVYSKTDGNLDGVVQVTDYDVWFANKAKIGNHELGYD